MRVPDSTPALRLPLLQCQCPHSTRSNPFLAQNARWCKRRLTPSLLFGEAKVLLPPGQNKWGGSQRCVGGGAAANWPHFGPAWLLCCRGPGLGTPNLGSHTLAPSNLSLTRGGRCEGVKRGVLGVGGPLSPHQF